MDSILPLIQNRTRAKPAFWPWIHLSFIDFGMDFTLLLTQNRTEAKPAFGTIDPHSSQWLRNEFHSSPNPKSNAGEARVWTLDLLMFLWLWNGFHSSPNPKSNAGEARVWTLDSLKFHWLRNGFHSSPNPKSNAGEGNSKSFQSNTKVLNKWSDWWFLTCFIYVIGYKSFSNINCRDFILHNTQSPNQNQSIRSTFTTNITQKSHIK